MQGGFFVGSALILFVVGLADDVVAGDVEGGVGVVESGFKVASIFVVTAAEPLPHRASPLFEQRRG